MVLRAPAHWLPLALVVPAVLAAQQPAAAPSEAPDTAPHKPDRLFRSKEPVAIWLQAHFKTVFKDRDTTSTKHNPATLRYLGEKGDTVTLAVQLSTRGHYRLKASTCSFPPPKAHF